MMIRFVLMALLALLPGAASASLAVMLCSIDRCVLGSDSRVWDLECDCVFEGRVVRKVDARGQYGVMVTHDPAPFKAWSRLVPNADESAASLMQRLLDAVPHGPKPGTSMIAVARFDTRDVVVKRVRFEPDGRTEVLREEQAKMPLSLILGWPFVSDDEFGAIMSRSNTELLTRPSEARMKAMARSILATGAANSRKIGGPLHFLTLDREGARWSDDASGGSIGWSGTGFWLSGVGTPTFRVGDPAGNRLAWDGADLTVGQGTLRIDSGGIYIQPFTSPVWDASSAYRFNVSNGVLGFAGFDVTNDTRAASVSSSWTGGGSAYTVQSTLNSTCCTGTPPNVSTVTASSNSSGSVVLLQTTQGNVANAGQVYVGGILELAGPSSGSAGGIAGYIHVTVGGTPYRLAVYNP